MIEKIENSGESRGMKNIAIFNNNITTAGNVYLSVILQDFESKSKFPGRETIG